MKIRVLLIGLIVCGWIGAVKAAEPVTIGVMEFVGKAGVSQDMADVLADMLAEEISRMGNIRVIGKTDIQSMLNLEKQKRLAGCTNDECMSEVGGALNMRWVVAGNISIFGKTYLLNLKLFDAASALVVGRVTRKIRGDEEDLLEELPEAAQELFDRVGARIGIHAPDRVTVAARHPQPITESPSSVIVITRKDIEESGATTLMELLRRYPAIHIYVFDPLYPTAMIRGNIRVLLVVDGREINLEAFVAPFYAMLPVGMHEIERIEIVLGPNSALYGANAVSAVINITTRPPGTDFNTDLFFAAGEHGTSIIEGMVGGGSGPLAVRGSVGIDQAGSWMYQGPPSKDIKRANLVLRLDLHDGALSLNGGIVSGSGRLFSIMGYMDFEKVLLIHTKVEFQLGKLKTRAYWYGLRTRFDLELGLIHPATGITLGAIPTLNLATDTMQVETQYDLEPFENNLLIAGTDFRLTNCRSSQLVDSDIMEYRFGIFLHDEHKFWGRFLLTIGARFDWNSKTDMAVSPRAALVYNPAGKHYLRISAGTAFRKPTLIETSGNFKVVTTFPEIKTLFEGKDYGISNPDLHNELLNGFEVGYRAYLFQKALSIGVDVYFDINRDWVSFDTSIRFNEYGQIDLHKSKIGYGNTARDFNIIGVNFSVYGEPVDELTLFLGGEYRYHWYIEKETWPSFTPRFTASTGGVLRCPFGLVVHLTFVYVGARSDERRDPESMLLPSRQAELAARTYLMVTLTHRLTLGQSRLDLGLTFFNPFGARFREALGFMTHNGSNFGGELLGPRAMFTARLIY